MTLLMNNIDLFEILTHFFKIGLTPCKAEQPLQAMDLQQKEAQKD